MWYCYRPELLVTRAFLIFFDSISWHFRWSSIFAMTLQSPHNTRAYLRSFYSLSNVPYPQQKNRFMLFRRSLWQNFQLLETHRLMISFAALMVLRLSGTLDMEWQEVLVGLPWLGVGCLSGRTVGSLGHPWYHLLTVKKNPKAPDMRWALWSLAIGSSQTGSSSYPRHLYES